jgi:hypothetical protein
VRKGVVPPLPGTPEEAHKIGMEFVNKATGGLSRTKESDAIPACNTRGERMISEIMAYPGASSTGSSFACF